MKAFRLECSYPYNSGYEYVICENEEKININIHSRLNVVRYKEIPLKDVYVEKLNCQSLINLLNVK